MFSLPKSSTFFSISETLVLNSSPSRTFSIITGINPEMFQKAINFISTPYPTPPHPTLLLTLNIKHTLKTIPAVIMDLKQDF
jgi:hypothetical protein